MPMPTMRSRATKDVHTAIHARVRSQNAYDLAERKASELLRTSSKAPRRFWFERAQDARQRNVEG